MAEFQSGDARLELSQADIARAVEYWLNERILRQPCVVHDVKVANSNQWQSVTFRVTIVEDAEFAMVEREVAAQVAEQYEHTCSCHAPEQIATLIRKIQRA